MPCRGWEEEQATPRSEEEQEVELACLRALRAEALEAADALPIKQGVRFLLAAQSCGWPISFRMITLVVDIPFRLLPLMRRRPHARCDKCPPMILTRPFKF